MLLNELTFAIGNSGVHSHVHKAITNMKHHAANHSDSKTRAACKDAVRCLNSFARHPGSMFEDPTTLVKLLSHFHGDPDHHRVTTASSGIGSYTQTDSD